MLQWFEKLALQIYGKQKKRVEAGYASEAGMSFESIYRKTQSWPTRIIEGDTLPSYFKHLNVSIRE